jgi:hypothetical protein
MLSAYETEVAKVAHVAKRSATWKVCSWPTISPAPTTSSPGFRRPVWTNWAAGGLPIQVADGVTRTLTCMVISGNRMPRASRPSCRPTIAVHASRSRKGDAGDSCAGSTPP